MGYRYCASCKKWLETKEYTVDTTGETVCPTHGHAVHGFISHSEVGILREDGFKAKFQKRTYRDRDEMLAAAKNQSLIR